MKVKLNGNVATLISNIKFEDLKLADKVEAKDEHGKTVYVCTTGCTGSINDFSATFTFANAEGNAAMNILIDVCPDTPSEIKKEYLADTLSDAISLFDRLEEGIIQHIEDIKADRTALIANIEEA